MYEQLTALNERITDLERRLSNQVRTGKIIAADYKKARVRVQSDEIKTGWRPWLTTRAGDDKSWWAPSVGEQVVLLSPSGEIENSLVLPAIFQDSVTPGQITDQIAALAFSDGTTVKYDKTTKVLSIDAAAEGAKLHLIAASDISIQSGGALSLKGETVAIEGPVTQTGGDMTSDGVSVQHHDHEVESGSSAGTVSEPNQ